MIAASYSSRFAVADASASASAVEYVFDATMENSE